MSAQNVGYESVTSLYIDIGDYEYSYEHCGAKFWYGEQLKGYSKDRRVVAQAELEALLLSHSEILDAAVIPKEVGAEEVDGDSVEKVLWHQPKGMAEEAARTNKTEPLLLSHLFNFEPDWNETEFYIKWKGQSPQSSLEEIADLCPCFCRSCNCNLCLHLTYKERTNLTNEDTLNDNLGHCTFVAGVIAIDDAKCLGFALRFTLSACLQMHRSGGVAENVIISIFPWRYEVFPDYDVWNIGYYNDGCIDHPNKLTRYPTIFEHDAQNKGAHHQRSLLIISY
ncbi:protein chromatin remodeling 5 isoform X1 [Tanacetum coccineum]|uniref:Protein chromatin remodeling 5 isoform X1 n=1 Tax=Tanacetum coccineum TaxID=301880 RepID=A0ABQ5FVX9_9ASTR